MFDALTFDIGDHVIQVVDGTVYIWKGAADHEADVVLPMTPLLSAMLIGGPAVAKVSSILPLASVHVAGVAG